MNVAGGASESPLPKNVGLLFFNEAPDRSIRLADLQAGRTVSRRYRNQARFATRKAADSVK